MQLIKNSYINKHYSIWHALLLLLCLSDVVYIGTKASVTDGLENLFLLPLGFTVAIFLFGKEFNYCRESIGLLLLYVTFAVRYVITPFLISASQSLIIGVPANAADYRMSILILLFELFATMLAIKVIWPYYIRKTKLILQKTDKKGIEYSFKLSWSGALIILMLIVLLFGRGHFDNVVAHLSTWFTRETNRDVLYTNDMIAFNVLKVAAFILVVAVMKRIHDKTNIKVLPVIVSILAAAANTMWYQYNERTDLAILIICSFMVLYYSFPKSKKMLLVLFGVGGVLLVGTVFLEGTLHYTVGESLGTVGLDNYEEMAQLYVTGPTMIANAHMNYDSIRSKMTLSTYLKDFVESLEFLSALPFTRFIVYAVSAVTSTGQLYADSLGGLPYILPNYSFACLYVSSVLGWIFDVILICIVIQLIGFLELKIKQKKDLIYIYALDSMIVRVGMAICCNNILLMIHAITINPIWLVAFAWINELGNKYKLKIKV